jgi:hypothetical protein
MNNTRGFEVASVNGHGTRADTDRRAILGLHYPCLLDSLMDARRNFTESNCGCRKRSLIHHVLVNTLKHRGFGNDFSAQNTTTSVYSMPQRIKLHPKRQASPNTQFPAQIPSLEISLPHGDPSLGISATPTPPFQPHQLTCSISGPNAPTSHHSITRPTISSRQHGADKPPKHTANSNIT